MLQFRVKDYTVSVRSIKDSFKIVYTYHHELKSVLVDAPEDLVHPVFERLYRVKIQKVIDEVEERTKRCRTMRVISAKQKQLTTSALEFRRQFVNLYGSIDDAKDDWDYNRAPKGGVITGKFGDLKLFLEMRKGHELNLGGVK